MIKHLLVAIPFVVFPFTAFCAEGTLQQLLPLLKKQNRSVSETQTVLNTFRTSHIPEVVFATGASLVQIPPTPVQEPALFSILMRSQDGLKQTFAAVIITAMGQIHEELAPTLEAALSAENPLLRSYAAAAYALIKPENSNYTQDIVRLYLFDPAFAQRALNVQTGLAKNPFKILRQFTFSSDEQIRAATANWLSDLNTTQATKELLKMAKKESAPSVQTLLATGLATHKDDTLATLSKGLDKNYTTPYATTCALALGFMTGNGIDTVRTHLLGKKQNGRINAARAAAYMAGVLASADGFIYSSDRNFDIHLLKGLIAPLKALEKSGNETEKTYAKNALLQIEKLME